MNVQDAPLAGASDVRSSSSKVDDAYRELVSVLERAAVPPQTKAKAKASFVYDQRELQKRLRSSLKTRGWSSGRLLAPSVALGRTRIPEVSADMLKDGVHVVLEFGNRASYSSNLLSRVAFGFVTGASSLAVMVTPTKRFADAIDTNLTTYERVVAELGRLAAARPSMLPGPLMVVGVEPDR